MTSFIQQFSGQEDTLRPVLEHFVGPLPLVDVVVPKIAGRVAEPADHWLRAGGTRHAAHQSPASHLHAAREHLALFLHLSRVDGFDPTLHLVAPAGTQFTGATPPDAPPTDGTCGWMIGTNNGNDRTPCTLPAGHVSDLHDSGDGAVGY